MRDQDWQDFRIRVRDYRGVISKITTANVNSSITRNAGREIVQAYFRTVRNHLADLGISEDTISSLDGDFQHLLALADGNNAKTSYKCVLAQIHAALQRLDAERELAISDKQSLASQSNSQFSDVEKQIIETLSKLVPLAALCYTQALSDLAETKRGSWRGTACELRECLRETLDQLAPDSAVSSSVGFKLETNQTRPTMKQKARFIMNMRHVPSGGAKPVVDSVGGIDELFADLIRSTYTKGSVSTHTDMGHSEVRKLKHLIDIALIELLELTPQA